MVKILTFTSLYPNRIHKRHGIFVENRLRHLVGTGRVQSRVVAPVPWFPSGNPAFGSYAEYAKVPRQDVRHKIDIQYPRYLQIPKLGMTLAPAMMAVAGLPVLRRIISGGYDFDLIDAHYFYPDGVAAIILGRILHKPVVITARGTDLNLIPGYRIPRMMIRWAAKHAFALVTVCQALKDVLVDLGVDPCRVTVLRNGVDMEMFRPPEHRVKLREQLGIRQATLLSVGHLIKRKGHDLVIQAMKQLPGMSLLIAGDGEEEANLRALVRELDVADRVNFLGAVSHDQLRDYYGAVDILVLASSREGWANVLLESMACGTPVVATNVWGTPEVVAAPVAGRLAKSISAAALAEAVNELLGDYPDRNSVRAYAEGFSWDATTDGQLKIFSELAQVPA